MGMDVYGRKPKSEIGEYFRRNVWGWHPLWAYCETMHEEIASKVQEGHSNSGDGLGAQDSIKLGKRLKKDVLSGVAAQYVKERDEALAALPKEACEYCDEDGNRTWLEDGLQVIKVCNACNGKKLKPPFPTYYFLRVEDIKEFSEFLENCGGFNIY